MKFEYKCRQCGGVTNAAIASDKLESGATCPRCIKSHVNDISQLKLERHGDEVRVSVVFSDSWLTDKCYHGDALSYSMLKFGHERLATAHYIDDQGTMHDWITIRYEPPTIRKLKGQVPLDKVLEHVRGYAVAVSMMELSNPERRDQSK